MAPTIPTVEPVEFVSGDTVAWNKTLSGFPASEYVLTYSFVTEGNQFAVTCTADGDTHQARMTIVQSAQAVGVYRWHSYATLIDLSERYQIDTNTTKVLTNFAAQASGYDPRTDAEKMLDALNATLVGKASSDQLSMSIQGRSLSRLSPEELLAWRNKMRSEVKREQSDRDAEMGLSTGNKIRTRC